MRHLHAGRKLGVDHSHRKAMIRSLALALIERDAIRTTPARAKELRRYADKLVTWGKKGDLGSRRQLVKFLGSTKTKKAGSNRVRLAMERLYTELVPRFMDRNGGYTQILKLGARRSGDNAEICIMRYLPEEMKAGTKSTKKGKSAKKSKKSKKTAKTAAKATKSKKTAKTSKTAKKKKTTSKSNKASDKGAKKKKD